MKEKSRDGLKPSCYKTLRTECGSLLFQTSPICTTAGDPQSARAVSDDRKRSEYEEDSPDTRIEVPV